MASTTPVSHTPMASTSSSDLSTTTITTIPPASSSMTVTSPVNPQSQLSAAEGFVSGALAACTAVTITNPMEVAKTRLQLDGELQKTVKKVKLNSTAIGILGVGGGSGVVGGGGGGSSLIGTTLVNPTQPITATPSTSSSSLGGAGATTAATTTTTTTTRVPPQPVSPAPPLSAAATSNATTIRPTPLADLPIGLQKNAMTGRVYTSAIDCLRKTWKYEGLGGVQRGLGAAYAYQIALNGSRLGFYEPFRTRINRLVGYDASSVRAWTSILAGASSGVVGAILGNPLFLVKARMQAYSPYNPVGAQHHYTSVLAAFKSIIKADGLKGLARGVDAAMLRTAMGSSVQLPAYMQAKKVLKDHAGMKDGAVTYLLASTFSGACVCAVMQPADTALTRMYNQSPNSIRPDGKPRGLLYKNPIDCLYKTFQTEGVKGWYKGTTAHLMRIAPHTVVTLVANEFISRKWLTIKGDSLLAVGRD